MDFLLGFLLAGGWLLIVLVAAAAFGVLLTGALFLLETYRRLKR